MTALLKSKQTTTEIALKGRRAMLDLSGALYLAEAERQLLEEALA